MPRFDELYVVSDLHLGGRKGFQIFQSGQLLGGLIAALAGPEAEAQFYTIYPLSSAEAGDLDERGLDTIPGAEQRVGLVLNGDVVDFLAEEPARYLDIAGAIGKLAAIVAREEFKPVFDALRLYLHRPNRRLIIVLGNHDTEIALPHVAEWLRELLTQGEDGARGRLTFATDGSGFRCSVGPAEVLCFHGEISDSWNTVDHQSLRALIHEHNRGNFATGWRREDSPPPPASEKEGESSSPSWQPNAGTRLVVDIMNDIKKRHPYVDLLKPEAEAVFPVLYALDSGVGTKVMKLARPLLSCASSAVWRSRFLVTDAKDGDGVGSADGRRVAQPSDRSLTSQERFARAAIELTAASATKRDLLAEVEMAMEHRLDPEIDLDQEGEDELLSLGRLSLEAGRGIILRLIGTSPEETLRRSLQHLLHDDRSFELDEPDKPYKWAEENVSSAIDFVIAGHTHLARRIPRLGGTYFNTGTWAALMALDRNKLEDLAAFKGTLDELCSTKSVEDLVRLGYAKTTPTVVAVRADSTGIRGAILAARQTPDGVRLGPHPAEQPDRWATGRGYEGN